MPPRRRKELSHETRAHIITLWHEGYTYSKIAKKTKLPLSTVWYTVKHAQKYHTLSSLPRSGRPHKFSRYLCRTVIQTLCRYRFEPYKAIATRVGGITASQVKYIARKKKYRRFIARRKPFIDRQKAIKRLEWARINRFRDWDSIIWTDEVQLGIGDQPNHPRVTRRQGEAFLPECIVPTFPNNRELLMAWGCISHGYKGPLICLDMDPPTVTSTGRK
ncbi:Winged helix turn helix protein [Ceratobasidium theobromae]|uniref:Winged helix turn helix protein n=1 Tax=Ceratobasidium theobromae TaxID=1582974 RepID=A0A5N5QAT4_9AGAM|nr:Winged helix turn helix protein [Ceratobasidium theobromae]